MKYRRRPVEVEAMRVPLTRDGSVASDVPRWKALEEWLGAPGPWRHVLGGRVGLETLDGMVVALPGDWIIRGEKGELYACSADFFGATYEPADQTPAPA